MFRVIALPVDHQNYYIFSRDFMLVFTYHYYWQGITKIHTL